MSKFFVAMYDEDDYPYMTFENYKEAARFLNTTHKVIACNICKHQKKKYRNRLFTLYKIKLNNSDVPMPSKSKNLHIGALLEILNV